MKKLLLILAFAATMLSCTKNSEDFSKLQSQIDELKTGKIASIQEQITNISSSIVSLQNEDKSLQGFITTLQEQKEALVKADEKLAGEIEQLKSEMPSASTELLTTITEYKTAVDGQIANLDKEIAELQKADEALRKQIEELKTYVDTQLKDNRDWASATFATLEQYNATAGTVASIQIQIAEINRQIQELGKTVTGVTKQDLENAISNLDASLQAKIKSAVDECSAAVSASEAKITEAYNAAISKAVSESEASIKTWVNGMFTGYYTIAETEAKLKVLKELCESGDASLKDDIKKMEASLEASRKELTASYEKALEDAITEKNGVINGKIAEAVDAATKALEAEIAAMDARVTEWEKALGLLRIDLDELLSSVQSISVVPDYSDGSVNMRCEKTVLRFVILPLSTAESLAKEGTSAFSVNAVNTLTKASNFVNLPISEVSFDGEVIKITVDGSPLEKSFFSGNTGASAQLKITSGKTEKGSGFFPLSAEAMEIIDLGLSVKWRSWNLGADRPWDNGLNFAWGDVIGQSWNGRSWSNGGFPYYQSPSYELDDYGNLLPEYDAAHVMLGGNWRMPTSDEFEELTSNCTVTRTEFFNNTRVGGYIFTSNKPGYTDNFIFLPDVTVSIDDIQAFKGGIYWSSTQDKSNPNLAISLRDTSPRNSFSHSQGLAIRPVLVDMSSHIHNLKKVNVQCPTAEAPGCKEYYRCTSTFCGLYFEDADGKVKIGDESDLAVWKAVGGRGYLAPVTEVVDLGLSVKWRSWNIGAETPEEAGDYFAWGATETWYEPGFAQEDPQSHWKSERKNGYNWANSPYQTINTSSRSSCRFTKYLYAPTSSYMDVSASVSDAMKSVLDPIDDAAHVILGNNWRMPTREEFSELLDTKKIIAIWVDDYCGKGVSGCLLIGRKPGYTDKSIFFVATGYRVNKGFNDSSTFEYWSSSLWSPSNPTSAAVFSFDQIGNNVTTKSRNFGLPVRPVYAEHHSLQKVSGKAPTDESSGWKDYYQCIDSSCNMYYEDADGNILIGDSSALETWKAEGGRGYRSVIHCSAESVDLGLSVKWATCNLGSTNPVEPGRCFAWGDIEGQTWNGMIWSNGGFSRYFTYEIDSHFNLYPKYDAAHVILGGDWRMPTAVELEELVNAENTSTTWVINYNDTGVNGLLIRSKKSGYTDKFIFLPASSSGSGNIYRPWGVWSAYWSSTNAGGGNARILGFDSSEFVVGSYSLVYGFVIRPVLE